MPFKDQAAFLPTTPDEARLETSARQRSTRTTSLYRLGHFATHSAPFIACVCPRLPAQMSEPHKV